MLIFKKTFKNKMPKNEVSELDFPIVFFGSPHKWRKRFTYDKNGYFKLVKITKNVLFTLIFYIKLLLSASFVLITSNAYAIQIPLLNAENDERSHYFTVGNVALVNATTSGTQERSEVFYIGDNLWLIGWNDDSRAEPDINSRTVRARIYNSATEMFGSEFVVPTTLINDQSIFSGTSLGQERVFLTWTDRSLRFDDQSLSAVIGRILDVSTGDMGPEVLINQSHQGFQSRSQAVRLSDGNLLVVWNTQPNPDGNVNVVARVFDDDLNPVTDEFRINDYVASLQDQPRVAALRNGGFAVTWQDWSQREDDPSQMAVRVRVFSSDYSPISDDILVNSTTAGAQNGPDIAALDNGNFVVTWSDFSGDVPTEYGVVPTPKVRMQVYSSNATRISGELYANLDRVSSSGDHRTAAFEGGFIIAGFSSNGADASIGVRAFTNDGERSTNSVFASPVAVGQSFPHIDIDDNGTIVVTWSSWPRSSLSDGDGYSIWLREIQISPIRTNFPTEVEVLDNDSFNTENQILITHLNGQVISSDAEGLDALSFDGVPLSSGANVTLTGDTVVYDPSSALFAIALPEGATADDSFSYTISDGARSDTANVTVTLTGVNDAPTADPDTLFGGEDASATDLTASLLANDIDPDTDETALLAISGIDTTGTLGQVAFNAGNVSYSPNGAFESLALNQIGNDTFRYTVADPGGLTSTAAVTVEINGANDAPVAMPDALTFAEEEGTREVTATLLANDTDVDTGETSQLAVTAVNTTLTVGRVTLTDGLVSYDPDGAFNALAEGQSVTDRFDYTISDLHGATATATAEVRINGFNGYALTVSTTGLGTGTITSLPLGINCGAGGGCTALFTQNTDVALSALTSPGTTFDGWSGECIDPTQPLCVVSMTQSRSVSARFSLTDIPDGRIVAATLPGARSGYVGGGDITVFMTVLSRQSTPAQSCRVTAPNDPPFTLTYRQVNAQNQIIGDENPLFDLGNGGSINFVLALTPSRATDANGYVFLPRIQCENADLAPIEGVNSVLVSIGEAPVPDILSIGATPSADGVVRIPATGNRINFMSAAAVNIAAADGSAGAGQSTVTARVDTGAASLPLTLEVCETASTGGCITPRGVDNVTTVFDSNVVKFFAVFVRANGDATVPFDPANARVFLRFEDANRVIRSATSAAVSAPAPADDVPSVQSAIPTGRWSVLVRQGSEEWPSLTRGSLYVFEDGTAILDDGETVSQMRFEGFVAEDDRGRFMSSRSSGQWTDEGGIQAGPVLSEVPGDFWGVRDARSDLTIDWESIAGRYGDGVIVASDGSISGTFNGCIVSGSPTVGSTGLPSIAVRLMSCDQSGSYRAVFDSPVNDNEPTLLIAGERNGWRVARQ